MQNGRPMALPARTRTPAGSRRRRGRTALARPRRDAAEPAITAGRDLHAAAPARERGRTSRVPWIACAAAGLAAALVLVQLRTESIALRYQLARSLQVEQQLLQDQRRLTVEKRQLRHPVRLAELGRQLGLARPDRVVELPVAASPIAEAPR